MTRKDSSPGAGDAPLGRQVEYPATVDPSVLFPVSRADARAPLGIEALALPFAGSDIWNAWEFSWLDAHGKPCVAVAELRVPCDSPSLIESKSLKLYLGGYAMTRFNDPQDARSRIADDVSERTGAQVEVSLRERPDFERLRVRDLAGESLDEQRIEITEYAEPNAEHLSTRAGGRPVEEALVTDLFRSRCPITGQPDWASVQVRYRGIPMDRAGLLRYLVSYREHAAFHEACVERMFLDIRQRCRPLALLVHARFLRRGGIDINPWRATPDFAATLANVRTTRQ
ncbi:MAG TPA: NADPH-dependent 7-cyano-7-deazaguanine reductase QueF [Rhodanobacteraceae bacterium]|nr:NADPH-dependent 7-cyano-7-deazaguanine reductase QueF [Rhodanobacteraceae bacterium]